MPLYMLDRIPIPRIRSYILFSVILHIACIYYAVQCTKYPDWRNFVGEIIPIKTDSDVDLISELEKFGIRNRTKEIMEFMFTDYLCLWVTINTVYCGMILFGKGLQLLFFGDLRLIEMNNMKEKFWNFVLYRFIFIFGVLKAVSINEVLIWVAWYSILGFLQIFAKLTKDRLDHITSGSMQQSAWGHARVLSFLAILFFTCCGLIVTSLSVGLKSSTSIMFFMLAECFLLKLALLYTIAKYTSDRLNQQSSRNLVQPTPSQTSSRNQTQTNRNNIPLEISSRQIVEVNRSARESRLELSNAYYILFILELAEGIIESGHYIHMLIWGNAYLSMASLAILMHLRALLSLLQRKIQRHRTYIWVLKHLEKTYPVATAEELAKNSDNCAICWDHMITARKLPCGHLFHMPCLQQWLEQDTSCPTCRYSLNMQQQTRDPRVPQQNRPRQHFFHFDGSRYIPWLPSFSVEVMHTRRRAPFNRSQLEMMAVRVQNIFPHYPRNVIVESLRQTNSIDVTIENILEGRVTYTPRVPTQPTAATTAPVENDVDSASSDETFTVSDRNSSGQESDYSLSESDNISNTQVPNPSTFKFDNNLVEEVEEPKALFFSTSKERENLLRKRREALINRAKNNYIRKFNSTPSSSKDL